MICQGTHYLLYAGFIISFVLNKREYSILQYMPKKAISIN